MKHNVWALGSRTITGDVGKVKAAGEVKAFDADIEKVDIAGRLEIENSYVQKMQVAGEVSATNTNFGESKVAGEVNIKGLSKADVFVIVGKISAELLECRILRNATKKKNVTIENGQSIVEFSGSFKAETFESLYKFRLSCDYDFKNIISTAELFHDDVLECENFYSFGPLKMEGVNAENIYIYPSSASSLESITGTNITVSRKGKLDTIFKSLPKSLSNSHYTNLDNPSVSIMALPSIEGDNINIDHVKADSISGLNVKIGELCVIEKVEYKDNIEISEKAIVNEVIKL